MSTLFTVRHSWQNRAALYEQLLFASNGDAVLLMQDAVLALQSPIAIASFLAKCRARGIVVYALDDDVRLRGIENKYTDVKKLDYAGFVDLVVQHDKQVAW